MLKRKIIYTLFLAAVIVGFSFHAMTHFSCAQSDSSDPNTATNNNDSSERPCRPMIIWWGRMDDPHETMRLALSSGIFTHVMLLNVHKYAKRDHLYQENIRRALELCKQTGVVPIWTRWLYPGSKLKDFTFEDAFSSEYYVTQIRNIKEEANQRGVDLVAFDTEPYANQPLKGITRRRLSDDEIESLNKAIDTAAKIAGEVDFVLPATGEFKKHFYNCTRRLGKFAISEYTYYDIQSTHTQKMAERRPYDVFGAYVSTIKENKYNPRLPLFTPREILQRQDLWAHKKGLFIYPGSAKNAAAIALEFSKIKMVYPVSDSKDVK